MRVFKRALSSRVQHHLQSLPIRTLTMSLRRSARVQVKPEMELSAGKAVQESAVRAQAAASATPAKKRARSSKTEHEREAVASDAIVKDVQEESTEHMPPPLTTPNKRRKTTTKVHPTTPTPAAIGLMTSSSPAAQTPEPPATRRVRPNQTNATLVTPGGTTAYSLFEDTTSPSKSGTSQPTTNKTLLSQACAHLLSVDPSLGPVIAQNYCKPFSPEGLAEKIDPFRSLASGIIGQQVSGAAAKSILNKFVGLFTAEECVNGFPSPKAVILRELSVLRTAGLSQRKAEYISGLAQKFASGEVSVKGLLEGSDESVMRDLVAVRGLGAWSVEMFMCFGLKRTDVFSTGDLGIQRGMAKHAGRDVGKLKGKGGKWKYMSEKEMVEMARKFSPFRYVRLAGMEWIGVLTQCL